MSDERMPYQIIEDMTTARRHLSDKEILSELATVPPLADEGDVCWRNNHYWHEVAYPYLALWNIAAERRLQDAIPLILDRACFGDPGEIMRNLCHALEAIVKPEWSKLAMPCVAALTSARPGTRLWAAHELQRLRDPSALPALEAAAHDNIEWVREWVEGAIVSIRNKVEQRRG